MHVLTYFILSMWNFNYFMCMENFVLLNTSCLYTCSSKPEHVALVQEFKSQFAEFKCDKCECDCEDIRSCECRCTDPLKCPSIWEYTQSKPQPMTTEKARESGRKAFAIQQELQGHRDRGGPIPQGLPTLAKKTAEEEPFKNESVFMKHFGSDWDMIKRIACDPAHQFYNLVKDLLALIGNFGSMKSKEKYLEHEQEHGRLKDINTVRCPVAANKNNNKKRKKVHKYIFSN